MPPRCPRLRFRPAVETLERRDVPTAGFRVLPAVGLTTTENGGVALYAVMLTSRPTANVTIAVKSDNPTEGRPNVSSLAFTPANWAVPHLVLVTGQADGVVDGDKTYHLLGGPAASTDRAYRGRAVPAVTLMNLDNRAVAGIAVSQPSISTTSEAGGKATFTVALTSKPTANVTVPVRSSDVTEGTVSAASLIFTPANWNRPQTVTVTGVDDATKDGPVAYTVITDPAISADPLYNRRAAADVALTNLDNEGPDLRDFDGDYTCSYSGSFNGQDTLRGQIHLHVNNGTIMVDVDFTPGGGTVALDGTAAFSVNLGNRLNFSGMFFRSAIGQPAGSGTVVNAPGESVVVSGTWSVTRNA